ncbi:NAD(P)-binding protein [Mycena alexandri]|uniref:NAD(P)-binding protein n=1 Tax=Mycena alexandri TaxID=1745969 RepID=A0AAD6XDH0_9AGAR|nr:NAD(P)-binding protein [Mycena alexandri]
MFWSKFRLLRSILCRSSIYRECPLTATQWVIVDSNGSEFGVGDRVFGASPDPKVGTLAQYVVVPSSSLAPQPTNVSAIEASGLAIVVATAYQALVVKLKIKTGQTVFINGGSSSVGSSAVQIAKYMGCKVVATASGKNKAFLQSIGVDEFIDYTEAPLVKQILSRPSLKFHAILDAAGLTDPALYLNSPSYLLPGGSYVTCGTFPKGSRARLGMLRQFFEGKLGPAWLGGVPRQWGIFTVSLEKKDIETVADLVTKGKSPALFLLVRLFAGAVKPTIDSVHSFDRENVMKAYEKLMSKRVVGKVVVKVTDEE